MEVIRSEADRAPEHKLTGIFFWPGLFLLLLASRLCHSGILWPDEDYHLAAAIQVLHGKVPYQDFWYDKPVLNALFYTVIGARTDWVLRLAGALYAFGACMVAFLFAGRLWTRREGYLAALLTAFCLIFYFDAANIPLQPDTLMILPHLVAVYFAWQRRFLLSGMAAGLAFLFNVKGLFVLAACALFAPGGILWLVCGFITPSAAALGWLQWKGAASAHWEQVWKWGLHYAGSSSDDSLLHGFKQVLNWSGFHVALVPASIAVWWKEHELRVRLAGWTIISLIAAGIGWRFLPHYFNQLLPPLVISASRGISLIARRPSRRTVLVQAILVVATAVPVVRFGPRYAVLAEDLVQGISREGKDLELERASRDVAERIITVSRGTKETIFVWGYLPRVIAYTRLPLASRFWDSQPLTGVPADSIYRKDARDTANEWAAANRRELVQSRPSVIVDGITLRNPVLDIHNYPDTREWLSNYCLDSTANLIRIYRRCRNPDP